MGHKENLVVWMWKEGKGKEMRRILEGSSDSTGAEAEENDVFREWFFLQQVRERENEREREMEEKVK